MDYRTESLNEIARRIKRDRDILDLKSFKWNSNDPINKINTPAIYMFEGRDTVKEFASKNGLGYPCKRHLEINIEIISKNDKNAKTIKELFQKTRRTIFCERVDTDFGIEWNPNILVAKSSFIKELRTKGPNVYEIPELVGIKLVLGLWYVDHGIFNEGTNTIIQ